MTCTKKTVKFNKYILSNEKAQKEYVEIRKAKDWIPFFIPYLKKGFNLLDCGCGVGSLTLDIAEIVFPGQVIGIDMDEKQLEIAKKAVKDKGISNVKFQKEDVYNLPFEKESFDAILAHTLLIHLPDQLKVMEIFRSLLKPKGLVGISDDDWGTAVDSPPSPFNGKNIELMSKVIQHNGGNPFYSRNLRGLLLKAGFEKTEGYALAPEHYGNISETRRVVSVVNGIYMDKEFRELVTSKEWITPEALDNLINENIRWAEAPDSFAAHMYCAAIGWK